MSRFLRYLRIAFSATCLIACVLLIVLWVRSYWGNDSIAITQSTANYFGLVTMRTDTQIDSGRGRIGGVWNGASGLLTPSAWIISHEPLADDFESDGFGFEFMNSPIGRIFSVPHWFLILMSTTLAAAPWLPWWSNRFGLRTLLITTTLVAVLLGLIVWATR